MDSIILGNENSDLPQRIPVYTGDRPASAMQINALIFNSISSEVINVISVNELPASSDKAVMWINICGLKDADSIRKLAEIYNIHTLTVEDVLNTKQQPKVETFDNYRFLSFKSIQMEKSFQHIQDKQKRIKKFKFFKTKKELNFIEEFNICQISMIIMDNMLITFQEMPGDPFESIKKRFLENAKQNLKIETGYLAYSIIDAVVDEYYLTLAHLEDDIESFENRAVKTSDDTFIAEMQDSKKVLFQIKRAMIPLRDNLVIISRRNTLLINDELKPFFQDLQENLNNAIETVENCRDWLSNIMDVNLSVVSYQMNKVMKILATVSAMFIPLTFIAGVYGMNFENMPELGKPWGYPVVLGCMGLISVSMIILFKIKRWF
jgi:magnesium transporter